MALAIAPQPPKVPNEEIYHALKRSLDDVCVREVENLRQTRGLSHEDSAVLSCVFDDLKAKVMGGIRQGSTIDASSTITGTQMRPEAPRRGPRARQLAASERRSSPWL
jgi:hypothetical protein